MKNPAPIDSLIAVTNDTGKIVLISVEYVSGRVRHLFPRTDIIPDRVLTFMRTSLTYNVTSNMTVYRHGLQSCRPEV